MREKDREERRIPERKGVSDGDGVSEDRNVVVTRVAEKETADRCRLDGLVEEARWAGVGRREGETWRP